MQLLFSAIFPWGSSICTVSDYRMDNWVPSPVEAKDFSCSRCVETRSEVHSASHPMGIGGPFPCVKRGQGVTLTTHP
jgi:hypothetical protein